LAEKSRQDTVPKEKVLGWLERKKRFYANVVPYEVHRGDHPFCHTCTKVSVLGELIEEGEKIPPEKNQPETVSRRKLLEWLKERKRYYANMVPNEIHIGFHVFCHFCTRVNVLKDLIKEARKL